MARSTLGSAANSSRPNSAPSALLHFTPMGSVMDNAPVITHGEGCYVFDQSGRRFFDGLAGLFAVQIGYSHGAEIATAATEQLKSLPYFPSWGFHHRPSLELAEKVCGLAPESFNKIFFVSGGSEANEFRMETCAAILSPPWGEALEGDHAQEFLSWHNPWSAVSNWHFVN